MPLGRPPPLTVITINCIETLKAKAFQIITGAVAQSTAVLKERFDFIHYTGGTMVGKIVYVRCAFSDRNLHSRMPLDPTHVRLK
jgi:acyl-CoA reductase-like NAD-dependent aldehyde dehydrogenase